MSLDTTAVPFKHPRVMGTLICKDPPIILGGMNGRAHDYPLNSASLDAFIGHERPMYYFFCPQWSFTNAAYLKTAVDALTDRMKRFPQHTYTILVNDPIDLPTVRAALPGVGVHVWNTNCTADPAAFSGPPVEAIEPEYDALYNARYSPYKRIELAAKVERLCLISRGWNTSQVGALRALVPNAYIPNIGENDQPRVLVPKEIASIAARSRCGLMLSGIEGQTRAIMEYLLCGLPVVTTPNYGGRDRFLTPSNSLFAGPDPMSVAATVRMVPEIGFDRHEIRAEALRAMEKEKRLLVQIVNSVIEAKGERTVRLEELRLPHKTSSEPNRLSYYFTELGYELPPPEAFVSATLAEAV
ncbi:MAG: glycosyltransferase [Methylorubrum rhodinum]|uniref:glycosyltransferase n=1 Tax=Methylorubrum rhodinum TaxID=29428 RepID=UPI003BB089B0